jgi:hypothetical protein
MNSLSSGYYIHITKRKAVSTGSDGNLTGGLDCASQELNMGLLVFDDKLEVLEEFLPEASPFEVFLTEQCQCSLVENIFQMLQLI